MVKYKKKIIFLLICTAMLFVTAGLRSFNALAETERIYVVAEDNGYIACEDGYSVDGETVLNMSFELPYVISIGEGYLGFGIVKAENASSALVDEDNSEHGYAVLFNDGTTVIGSDGCVAENVGYDKTSLVKRDYTYKVTFDNKNKSFVLERKLSGSNFFSTVQSVNGLKVLPDGEYVFGIMFSRGTEIVLDELSFGYEQKEINSAGLPTYSDNLDKKEGGAFVEIECQKGNAISYSNENAISAVGEAVVSVETSAFRTNGGRIGFAVGTEKNSDGTIVGESAVFYSLNQSQGVTKYSGGNIDSGTFIDEYVNVDSVFASGRNVKALFDFTEDTFTLLVRLSEGSSFKEVFKDTSANLPSGNVFVGLQAVDTVYVKASEISVYRPSVIENYAKEGPELVYDAGDLIVTETATSTKITLEEGSFAPCKFIYTEMPVSVAEDESVIVYMENIRWTMESPSYYQRTSFTFAKGNSHQAAYGSFYTENTCVSLQYDLSRSTYWLNVPNFPQDQRNKVISSSISFYSLFGESGNSLMAVFSPKYNTYSLYMKSKDEPDYVLCQSFTVPLAAQNYVNGDLYVGFEVYGGMTIELDEFKVYTAKNEDIAVAEGMNLEFVGNGKCSQDGFILSANSGTDAYATFNGFTVSDEYDYLALEYSVESISYSDALYSLGFFITNGTSLPPEPEVKDRASEGSPVISGSFVDGATSDFYAFIASNGLTETTNDKMRGYMFHAGYSLRVLFSFKNKTATMQYKLQSGYSWNDIAVYEDLSDYAEGCNILLAFVVEDGVKVSLSGLRAYALIDYERTDSYVFENTSADDIGDSTLCTISVNTDEILNRVFIDEENVKEKTLIMSTEFTLYAEAVSEYVFDGWFEDGVKVSGETEYTVTAVQSKKYVGVFLPASYVVINNGQDKAQSVVSRFFASGKTVGINPESVQRYSFVGWTIAFKEVTGGEENVICEYELSMGKNDDENNLLKNETGLFVWGSLKNKLTVNDSCSITEELNGSKTISFGLFSVVDRKGYENGALIINVPEYDSVYDGDGNVVVERYVEITANYEKKEVQTSLVTEENYSQEYSDNLDKTFIAFIIVVAVTALSVAALFVLKRFLNKK